VDLSSSSVASITSFLAHHAPLEKPLLFRFDLSDNIFCDSLSLSLKANVSPFIISLYWLPLGPLSPSASSSRFLRWFSGPFKSNRFPPFVDSPDDAPRPFRLPLTCFPFPSPLCFQARLLGIRRFFGGFFSSPFASSLVLHWRTRRFSPSDMVRPPSRSGLGSSSFSFDSRFFFPLADALPFFFPFAEMLSRDYYLYHSTLSSPVSSWLFISPFTVLLSLFWTHAKQLDLFFSQISRSSFGFLPPSVSRRRPPCALRVAENQRGPSFFAAGESSCFSAPVAVLPPLRFCLSRRPLPFALSLDLPAFSRQAGAVLGGLGPTPACACFSCRDSAVFRLRGLDLSF